MSSGNHSVRTSWRSLWLRRPRRRGRRRIPIPIVGKHRDLIRTAPAGELPRQQISSSPISPYFFRPRSTVPRTSILAPVVDLLLGENHDQTGMLRQLRRPMRTRYLPGMITCASTLCPNLMIFSPILFCTR